MTKNLFRIFIITLAIFSIKFGFVQAQTNADVKLDYSGLVQCDGVVNPSEKSRNVKCDFYNLMKIINKAINIAFVMTIPVVTAMFAYAGFLHISGKEDDLKRSKKMLTNAIIGFIISLVAWFAVTTLVKWIQNPNFTGIDTLIQK